MCMYIPWYSRVAAIVFYSRANRKTSRWQEHVRHIFGLLHSASGIVFLKQRALFPLR